MQRLALVVVESEPGIVFVHPPGGPANSPASLPSGVVLDGETPEDGAVRLVREQTGLDVAITGLLVEFEQEGTPYGTAAMTGFVARVRAGELREGEEGTPAVYALDDLPAIIPVRAANQRVLAVYLSRRRAADTWRSTPDKSKEIDMACAACSACCGACAASCAASVASAGEIAAVIAATAAKRKSEVSESDADPATDENDLNSVPLDYYSEANRAIGDPAHPEHRNWIQRMVHPERGA
jgi:ADP-ribose pyrophosphatase YjhB (NUDIX family)